MEGTIVRTIETSNGFVMLIDIDGELHQIESPFKIEVGTKIDVESKEKEHEKSSFADQFLRMETLFDVESNEKKASLQNYTKEELISLVVEKDAIISSLEEQMNMMIRVAENFNDKLSRLT